MLNEAQTESIVNCDYHLKKIMRVYLHCKDFGHEEEDPDTAFNGDMLNFLNDGENYTWQGGDSSALENRCPDLTKENIDSYDKTGLTKFLWKQMTTSQKLECYERVFGCVE
jgi:hypothetical protein